ncbi:fibronectin [Arthrobacter sp. SPG23]|uniref:hypothetical protein n=1 Tax=Arthrobacter sp. SPG23 TaxID=1610703 RepID=UPI0005BC60BC|nr:hypothetical protein [Arthrobacter sp. SPG23]KIS25652.1 fibronectin [Arthrobacter sp. SPG23]
MLFRRLFGRGVATGAVLVVATLFGATAASAFWPATGTGSTTAAVATLAPPANVTVPSSSNSTVAVSWTGSTGIPAPTGYYVTRIAGTTAMPACGSSPATLITGASCTDASVPAGTHQYVVTAVYRSWTASSLPSATVTVSSATFFNFAVQPATTAVAGSALPSVTVELRTASGTKLPTPGVQVTVAIGANPGGGTLSGTLTATTNSLGEATFSGLSINKAGTGYTLVASSPGVSGAVSSTFTVTAAAATQLVVSGPASGTASATATVGPFTVQRQDAYGNPVTAGSTDVALASNSSGTKVFAATAVGATVTKVTIPAGAASASFFYGDTKAGTPTVSVSAVGMAAAAQPVTISAAAAFKLLFGPTPIAPVKNAVISPAVTVSVVDTFGNLTASTAAVTVSSQCVLKGTLTETAAGGVASFPNLTFYGNGSGCTVVATSAPLQSATSNTFSYG